MRLKSEVSVFARMTALAQRYQALNLAQGLMWMEPDPALLEWALRQMRESTAHQYTLPEGHLGLRTVVAQLGGAFFRGVLRPGA